MAKGWLLPLALVLVCIQTLLPLTLAALTVTSTFNQSGVAGTIRFTQANAEAATIMDVSLTGLNDIDGSPTFQWHVHEYPFPNDGGTVFLCGVAIVGGHYDPTRAFDNPNYATQCNQQTPQNCEVGDLSGKFGNFQSAPTISLQYTDENLDLYGVYSIIGRSIVIHFENATRFVCANIGYPDSLDTTPSTGLLYSPFRNIFSGNIFYRQHSESSSTASVYTDLIRITGAENSTNHPWHIHRNFLDTAGQDCSLAGPHYNPRNEDITQPEYLTRCGNMSPAAQMQCEIGDLSNKSDPFNVSNRMVKHFYSDTDLPLLRNAAGFLVNDRSTVIHSENLGGPRINCANLTSYQPLEAVARFDESGVTGSIRFYQRSPYDPTQVFVNLKGLQSRTAGYHVHLYPVGPGTSPERCADRYTGGHLNPTNVDIMVAGTTSDQFEVGDLSGKFGSLSGQNDFYREYTDPNIPLFGPSSILDRSIVIHEDDAPGTRFVCSNIQRVRQVVLVSTPINTDFFNGSVTFSQPADDPYTETTVVVDLTVQQQIPLTANNDGMVPFNWSYRQSPTSTTSCGGLSELAVFSSNPSLCTTSFQLACGTGDLTRKHGTLLIPSAVNGYLRKVYTDTNLPLHTRPGLDSVFGQDRNGYLYISPTGGDPSPVVCAQSNAAALVEAPPTDPTPTDGATPVAQVSSLIILSISLACVVLSVVNW